MNSKEELIKKFKGLITDYKTLSKEELIKKLIDKNLLLLKQENEIKRLNDENKNLKELETSHQQTNGQLHKEIKELKEDLSSPLKTMREVGVL